MYQAKVENTQEYSDSQGSHVVTIGKLIIIEKEKYSSTLDKPEWYKYAPIIISETEEIITGNKVYNKKLGKIVRSKEDDRTVIENNYRKILAFPEHFSDKHLQAIVDGKIKDGDEVLVKCQAFQQMPEGGGFVIPYVIDFYGVHLDQQNHITLFPAKQSQNNMFSDEEIDLIKEAAHQYAQKMPNSPYHRKIADKLNKIGDKLHNFFTQQSVEEAAKQYALHPDMAEKHRLTAKYSFKAGAEWAKKNNY